MVVSLQSGETLGWEISPIGKTLKGTYRIDEMVNQGGMSWLYKATHLALEEPVAIKLLFPQLVQDRLTYKRFLDEARIQFKLRHSNVVQVTDLIAENCYAGIVMEWVEGLSLKEYLLQRKELLSLSELYACIRPLLDALQYSHDQGVVHRDLKPGNILLARAPSRRSLIPKLSDFGVAKVLNDYRERTATGMALGTFKYISPEQIKDSKNVDHRADIYGIGVILYQLMTGRLPFEGNMERMLYDHIYTKPLSPMHFNSHLPRELCDITLHCLNKNPEDRFPSCYELALALEAIMPTHGVLNWLPGMQNNSSRELSRSRSSQRGAGSVSTPVAKEPAGTGSHTSGLSGYHAPPQQPISAVDSDHHATYTPQPAGSPVPQEGAWFQEAARLQFDESGSWIGYSVMDMLKEYKEDHTKENHNAAVSRLHLKQPLRPKLSPFTGSRPDASLELDRILWAETKAPEGAVMSIGSKQSILDVTADEEIERAIASLAYYQSEDDMEETNIIAPEANMAEWVESSAIPIKTGPITPIPENSKPLGRQTMAYEQLGEMSPLHTPAPKDLVFKTEKNPTLSLEEVSTFPVNENTYRAKSNSSLSLESAAHPLGIPAPPSQEEMQSMDRALAKQLDEALRTAEQQLARYPMVIGSSPSLDSQDAIIFTEVEFLRLEEIQQLSPQSAAAITIKPATTLQHRLWLYILVFLGIFSLTLGVFHLLERGLF